MTSTVGPRLSVVIPILNEQEILPELYWRLTACLREIELNYEILFVDDGSSDDSPELLDQFADTDPRVMVLHLSRNFGHQAALTAGLEHARGDAIIVMDGDLQDPPEVLNDFVDRWRQGYEVIYAVRTKRKEGLFKRSSYYLFYRLLAWIGEHKLPLDSGDFCLLDRKVVDAINRLPERVRFVRGLRSFVGFRQIGVVYQRAARQAGVPGFTFRSLVRLAKDGILSFSSFPLRLASYFGLVGLLLGVGCGVWLMVLSCLGGSLPDGAMTIFVVLVMGSIQLLCLGIVGEYLAGILHEVKRRPAYIVREIRQSSSQTSSGQVPNYTFDRDIA